MMTKLFRTAAVVVVLGVSFGAFAKDKHAVVAVAQNESAQVVPAAQGGMLGWLGDIYYNAYQKIAGIDPYVAGATAVGITLTALFFAHSMHNRSQLVAPTKELAARLAVMKATEAAMDVVFKELVAVRQAAIAAGAHK